MKKFIVGALAVFGVLSILAIISIVGIGILLFSLLSNDYGERVTFDPETQHVSLGEHELTYITQVESVKKNSWWSDTYEPIGITYTFELDGKKIGEYVVENPDENTTTLQQVIFNKDKLELYFSEGVNYNTNQRIEHQFTIGLKDRKVAFNKNQALIDNEKYPESHTNYKQFVIQNGMIRTSYEYQSESAKEPFILEVTQGNKSLIYNRDTFLQKVKETRKDEAFQTFIQNPENVSILFSESQKFIVFNDTFIFEIHSAVNEEMEYMVEVSIVDGGIKVNKIDIELTKFE